MKQPIQIRQGDVLLVRIDNDDTEGYMPVPRDAGRVVLAYGEATGHAHAIYDDGATLLRRGANDNDRILKIEGNVVYLRHEEHTKHELPPGLYRVVRQREYSADEIRRVAD